MHDILKYPIYLFSREHDIGSYLQYTQNCGYKSNDSSSNFLFTQALSLEFAVLAGTLHRELRSLLILLSFEAMPKQPI